MVVRRAVIRKIGAVLLVGTCLAATACGVMSPSAASTPAGEAGASAGYPVRISNCGTDYTFTKAPSRVVVMNGASVAEVSSLLALGLGDRIVANAQSYGASEEPGRVERIGQLPTGGIKLNDLMDIPREAMLGLRPDFVISTSGTGFDAAFGFATREELAAVGANTYVPRSTCGGPNSVDGGQTIEDSYTLLRDLGTVFGVRDRAERLIDESRRRIAAVGERVAGRPAPRVMLIIPGMDMGTGEFSSVGGNAIWNDIIAKAGGVNAFGEVTRDLFANLSKEQLAAAQVDAVVVVSWHNPHPDADADKLLAEFPHWAAAAGRRYVVLSDSIYLGPDNAVAVERIARLIHPDAF